VTRGGRVGPVAPRPRVSLGWNQALPDGQTLLASYTGQVMATPTSLAVGARLPFFFTYRDTLFGPGFVVEVHAVNGRALCVREGDEVWMYGVNPGAMAAGGADVESARAAFRTMFSDVLKDLASEAGSFEEFATLVRRFFDDTNVGFEPEWDEAVQAVRNRTVDPGEDMPRLPAESPRSVAVQLKLVFTAADNEPDLTPALAA